MIFSRMLDTITIFIIIIIIIIIKALRLAAAVFMCFFQFGRRRENSALRACCYLS